MAKVTLKPDEEKWVNSKWGLIRQAQMIADEANNRWKRINSEINDWLNRGGVEDIKQRTKIKSESIPLKDALETGKWHSGNAQRHIDDLMLFLKLKEMEIL